MYLTINETAELLRVSEQTLRKYAKTGQIPPPLKIGGSLRWDADELQTYIRNNNQRDFDGQLRVDSDEFRTWAKQFSFYPREGTNDS